MIYRLVVPGPIEDVEEIRVLEWHRREGTFADAQSLLVELETHKSVVEVRPTRGVVLRRILCSEGAWQAIGQVLALLTDAPDEPLPEAIDAAWPTLDVEFAVT